MTRAPLPAAAAAAALLLLSACAATPASTSTSTTTPSETEGGTTTQQVVTLLDTPLTVYTFQPNGCTPTAVLLVFHGLERNAAGYRDDAIALARRACLFVVAPLFDSARFPTWRYQRGGIVHHGVLQPRDSWTVRFVPLLADWARASLGQPGLPLDLLGHSAGAQFLSRVLAYSDPGARRSAVADPSTWVTPSLSTAAPYGFGGAFPPAEAEPALRRYLSARVTVLLGGADTGSRNLARSRQADTQGANRLDRGQTVFAAAQAEARSHGWPPGWPFGWRLAIVPGVGHDARRMFTSDAAFAALAPPR